MYCYNIPVTAEKTKEGLKPVEVLISEERLQKRIGELAAQIATDYEGKDLILLGVLKGSVFFLADLTRALHKEGASPILAFKGASSYGSEMISSGNLKETIGLDTDIEGKHVLVVEDIADTGHTLEELLGQLQGLNPASLKTCVLLDKVERREVEVPLDYVGFPIPNVFVVGYCIDYNEMYRYLPFVGFIK